MMDTLRILLHKETDSCNLSTLPALNRLIIKADLGILGFFQLFFRNFKYFSTEIPPVFKRCILNLCKRFFKTSLLNKTFYCFRCICINYIQCKFKLCDRVWILRRSRYDQLVTLFPVKTIILGSQDFVNTGCKQGFKRAQYIKTHTGIVFFQVIDMRFHLFSKSGRKHAISIFTFIHYIEHDEVLFFIVLDTYYMSQCLF